MVPLLVLGIPGSGTTAVMLGAMDIVNVTPGPDLFTGNQEMLWLWFGGFLLANILFVAVAFMLLPVFVRVLETPRPILFAVIAVLTVVGTFALEQTLRQAWLMFAMGILGYVLRKFDFPVGPVVLAIVLAPLIELGIRRALAISNGELLPIVTRPIVGVLLVLSVITFFSPYFPNVVRYLSRHKPGSG
jgi:putative tricarboxylic transport membrane protein